MPRALIPLVFFCFLAVILGIALARDGDPRWPEVRAAIGARFPAVSNVTPNELAAWLDDGERPGPLLLDVRKIEEFSISHLPNALRVEPGSVVPELPDDVTYETPIVVYCSVGYRSSAMAEHLMELGFSRVLNLDGSIFRWANEGNLVVRDGHSVGEVHPFNKSWGKLLDSNLHPPDLP